MHVPDPMGHRPAGSTDAVLCGASVIGPHRRRGGLRAAFHVPSMGRSRSRTRLDRFRMRVDQDRPRKLVCLARPAPSPWPLTTSGDSSRTSELPIQSDANCDLFRIFTAMPLSAKRFAFIKFSSDFADCAGVVYVERADRRADAGQACGQPLCAQREPSTHGAYQKNFENLLGTLFAAARLLAPRSANFAETARWQVIDLRGQCGIVLGQRSYIAKFLV